MFRYAMLVKRPSSFRNLTGINVQEFERLYERFEPLWIEAEQKRLGRANRQRKIGGGRRYALDLHSQLMMTLIWLHLYLSTETLGVLVGVNKSAISRNTRRVLPILRQLGQDTVWWQEPPGKQEGKTLEEAQAACPDLLAVIDVMEQVIERPAERTEREAHYSSKKKAHTRKTALIVNEVGKIRGVTNRRPGRTHDLTILREAGLLPLIPKEVVALADKAFYGLQNDLPEHSVGLPHKANKYHALEDAEKWANRDLARQRVIVENTICELRHFRILADRFRHALHFCTEVIYAVIALVNPRIAARLA
jgi:hypothetical protein